MKKSVWSETVELPQFEKLKGDINTDVLIIGGGLCGILCAYYLTKSGVDCTLVEGNTILSGVTKNTTGKITSQHGLIYADLLRSAGAEKAQMYLQANENALKEYERLSKTIDCDFEKKSAFTYSLTDRQIIEDEVLAVNKLGFPAQFSATPETPLKTKGAICFPNQAQFNPYKFASQIVKDIKIYENTFIQNIVSNKAEGEDCTINAKKIIVATHFPFINRHGSYFLKLYQHRSYVTAFNNIPLPEGMYVDENDKGMSFRSYKNFLLVGGGGHRTGKKGGAWQETDKFIAKNYPSAKPCYRWATQDCMSLDSVAYIGRYSLLTPDLYVATGFNKWGITTSMVSAMILTDLVQGKKNDFQEVFSPQRSMLKPRLFVNGMESTINLLTPSAKRCSHLGCALKWNKAEHTWDCACHGSRFEKDGKLINNPATKGIDI